MSLYRVKKAMKKLQRVLTRYLKVAACIAIFCRWSKGGLYTTALVGGISYHLIHRIETNQEERGRGRLQAPRSGATPCSFLDQIDQSRISAYSNSNGAAKSSNRLPRVGRPAVFPVSARVCSGAAYVLVRGSRVSFLGACDFASSGDRVRR